MAGRGASPPMPGRGASPPMPGRRALGRVGHTGWLLASSVAVSAVLAAMVGLFRAGLFPIAQAQAHRAGPERFGAMNALLTLGGGLFLPVPLLLGPVADGLGLRAALARLLLQPAGVAAIAVGSLRARRRGGPTPG